MSERLCWNCGHAFEYHNRIEGGCTHEGAAGRCDCEQYEDGQYLGHQSKRDLYTVSDRRRLPARRSRP